MNNLNRLEDMSDEWSNASKERVAEAAEAITSESIAGLPALANSSDSARRFAIRELVLERATDFAATKLLPEIMKWLAARGVAMPASDRIRSDVDLAIRHWSPAFDLALPAPESRVPFTSLAVSAATGARSWVALCSRP